MEPYRALWLMGLCLPQVIAALPGSLMESHFPTFSSQADVRAAAVSGDGSVFILGGFSTVDGVARNGLAKLSQDGFLDTTFTGTLLDEPGTFSLGGQENGAAQSGLFALPGGRVMQLGQNSWTLHNADGSPNVELLAEFPRTGSPAPQPQFVTQGRVFIVGGTPAVIHAYQASDLSPDVAFQMEAGPRPVWQAVPADSGKLWVLGRSPAVIQDFYAPVSPSYSLFRLEVDGAADPTFAARDLPANYDYALTSAENGGFRLTRDWRNRFLYWPSPTRRSLTVERHDAAGGLVATANHALPFSWHSREVVFQAPDRLIYPDFNVTRLFRSGTSPDEPDPGFLIMLAAPESPVLGPVPVRTLDAFVDGKLLVGGTRRMLADGSVDTAWHIPRLEKSAVVSHLTRLPDGSLLAAGDFDRADGVPMPGLVKLSPDDSVDEDFTPSHDFRFARKIRQFPDGSLLVLFSVPVVDALGNFERLARFSASGGFISLWPVPDPPGGAVLHHGAPTDFAIQSDGTTLVTTRQDGEVRTVGFRRIGPDGSPLLAAVALEDSSISGALLVLADDSYLRGNVRFAADGTLLGPLDGISEANPVVQLPDDSVVFLPTWETPRLQKWHPVSGVDTAFGSFTGNGHSIPVVSAASHGKALFSGFPGFVRLHSTGQLDPTFRPGIANPEDFIDGGNGTVLVAGNFETIDGQPRSGIARLADTRAVGFGQWMAAATARAGLDAGTLTESADADHDGSSNWLEYAAATDPIGSAAAQPRHLSGVTWRLPCNPEAPEISRRLETSSNLGQWHAARGDELRLESNGGCLTWSLLPGAWNLFTRVRVE